MNYGEGGERVIDSLKGIAPDLGKYVVEFAFGDIYSRKGLDPNEVIEAITHCVPYIGFPRVLNAT